MEHKVKQIDIVLENCEVFKVPIEHIDISATGIKRNISTWNSDGTVLDELSADKVILIINSGAFNITSNFDESLLDRITKHQDISHIDIIYDDGTNDYVAVPWGDEEYVNTKQSSTVDEDRLIIRIEEEKK